MSDPEFDRNQILRKARADDPKFDALMKMIEAIPEAPARELGDVPSREPDEGGDARSSVERDDGQRIVPPSAVTTGTSFGTVLAALAWRYTARRVLFPAILVAFISYMVFPTPHIDWILLIAFLVEHIRSQVGRGFDRALRVCNATQRRFYQGQLPLSAMIRASSNLARSQKYLFWTHDLPWALGMLLVPWLVLIGLAWMILKLIESSGPIPFGWIGVGVLGLWHGARLLTLAAGISRLASKGPHLNET